MLRIPPYKGVGHRKLYIPPDFGVFLEEEGMPSQKPMR